MSRLRPRTAFFMAEAATSPNISSTSFLAPTILSAKVILSIGGASLANFCCLGVIGIPPSFIAGFVGPGVAGLQRLPLCGPEVTMGY